jgi:mercuric ion transport protein
MKPENISTTGTIVASFLAASCCIGPAVFIIFGTSASFLGNLSFMESLRPYLLGVAVLLFGFSFWKLYLKKLDCSCEEDFRIRKIARGILWIGAVAIVFSASFQSVLIHLYQ